MDANEVLSADSTSLHLQMRAICRRRQRKTSGVKKAKWAIYEKEQFNSLVDDIKGLVEDLVQLFRLFCPSKRHCVTRKRLRCVVKRLCQS